MSTVIAAACTGGPDSAITINHSMAWANNRKISINAKLYRNGILVCEITNRSRSLFHGCRGSAYIIGSGVDGTILWEIQLRGKTAGGLLDCFCSSYQKARVTHRIRADDVPNTHHMDVFYDLQELPFPERFRHVSA